MSKTGLGLPVLLLSLATLPLACSQSPNGQSTGSGGAGGKASGGSSGSGGSPGGGGSIATGGSGGSTTGTGGSTTGTGGGAGASGTGGSASGGASGGPSGAGGNSGSGGSNPGGAGGSSGSGGSSPGGAGGSSGSGGSNPGGAGGAAGSGGAGGSDDAGPAGGDDALADASPAPSCTDKTTNGDETDTDCGGGTCPKCRAGKTCKTKDDCTSGGCTAGKCDDPFAATAPVTNPNNANVWTITAGTTALEVQTGGGKIVTYSLDGTNFLVINNASTGSVFWIAPQSEWSANGWPPPSEMDENTAFTASAKDNVLSMAGPTGTDGLTISKRFWANTEHQTVTMEYTFKNGSSAEIKKAPWEITRVYPGGLTFFPYAETPVQMPGTCNCFLAVPFTTTDGVAWFQYKASQFTQDIKGGADGLEGWAAHINCGTGLEQTCTTTTSGSKSLILIKEWDDSTTQAPGEKEVELYANAGHNYVEFEQQGNYQSVPAGASVVWTMHWMLRYLPTDTAPTPGNADLVTWVRGQLL